MKRYFAKAVFIAALCGIASVHADDAPAFDRPGIAFSTATLPQGGVAWEQGLPDIGIDRSQGQHTASWAADTLLRWGVSTGVELQLGADSYGGVKVRGNGIHAQESSGGDGWASVKWAPVFHSSQLTLALLGTASLPFGRAPVGGGGHDYDLGVAGSWAMPGNTSVSLYADKSWGEEGRGWLFAPSYSFPLASDYGGYIEAGCGSGSAYTRSAGGGVTHMLSSRLQVDASFLRGLDAKSQYLQGGIGLAWYFN